MHVVLFLLLCFTGWASAHVVEQFYGEIVPRGNGWELEVLFDVGYATEEGRGDAESAPPTHDWLVERTAEEFRELVNGSEAYLRACLGFSLGGETLEVEYHFGDFDQDPPEFYQNVLDGAYFRVTISPREESEDREVRCRVSEGERPSFVFGRRDEWGELSYLTARPGEAVLIAEAGEASGWFVFQQGFAHVIPFGLDHVLFICALFLAARQWRFLLEQSLVFTVAHSLTLGIAAAGFISISPNWVEPLIAVSILFLAVENLCLSQSKRRRFSLIFLFGLLHGLGFAAVLQRFLIDGDRFLSHLALMNLGVEFAQITILGGAWILSLKWHRTRAYRSFTLGANTVLIVIAGWWFIERI